MKSFKVQQSELNDLIARCSNDLCLATYEQEQVLAIAYLALATQEQVQASAYMARTYDRIATALESIVGNHTVSHIDPESARELTKQLKDQLKAAREQS